MIVFASIFTRRGAAYEYLSSDVICTANTCHAVRALLDVHDDDDDDDDYTIFNARLHYNDSFFRGERGPPRIFPKWSITGVPLAPSDTISVDVSVYDTRPFTTVNEKRSPTVFVFIYA